MINITAMHPIRVALAGCLCLASATSLAATPEFTTSDGMVISPEEVRASGSAHVIWLPSEDGPQEIDETIALRLAALGISSWRVDLVGARFLPMLSSSVDMIPATDVAELLDHALVTTEKMIYVVTTGRSVIPVLRGLHHWQQQHEDLKGFGGAILFSPKLFLETPDPGQESRLMPVVSGTNLPIYLLQAEKSPWYWQLEQSLTALRQSGSDVIVNILPQVRDRFYFRAEVTRAEQVLAGRLPNLIQEAIAALAALPRKPRPVSALAQAPPAVPTSKKARELKPYRGNPEPPALHLETLGGGEVDLRSRQGTVVLVNFWASWCPPCVHEMPSMERLRLRLRAKPFEILAVNMAEEPPIIRAFLDTQVTVNFVTLLDKDGAALKRWGVFAFPTSFIIDKRGRIRYALFGAYEWDQADAMQKIQSLMEE